jgi:hypothetical protein
LKGLAKFLGVLYAIFFWIMVLVTILIAAATVLIFIGLDISFIREAIEKGAISVSSLQNYTPEMIAQFRMPLTFLMVGVVILMLLALIVIRSVRKALKETGRGTPFSMVTVKSLRTAGIVSLISFVLGIVIPFAAIFLFKDIPDVQTPTTTFITEGGSLISALIYFLLSGVAKYGNSLAPDEDVFSAPPVAGDYDDTETY